jgi:hypothetical protein
VPAACRLDSCAIRTGGALTGRIFDISSCMRPYDANFPLAPITTQIR